jgi:hypothetical protein
MTRLPPPAAPRGNLPVPPNPLPRSAHADGPLRRRPDAAGYTAGFSLVV